MLEQAEARGQVEEGEKKVGPEATAIEAALQRGSWKSPETDRPSDMREVLHKARTEELPALQNLIIILKPW